MTQKEISRRGFTGMMAKLAPAAVIASAAPAIAETGGQTHSDARLIELAREYAIAGKNHCDADESHMALAREARAKYPAPPSNLIVTTVNGTRLTTEQEISRCPDYRWPGHSRETRLAALAKYKSECKRIDQQTGLPEMERAVDVWRDEFRRIERLITDTPARSTTGLFIKLAVECASIDPHYLRETEFVSAGTAAILHDLMAIDKSNEPDGHAQAVAALAPYLVGVTD